MQLFNTVRIRTPESTELEFVLAGIGNRALALTIDYIILNLSLLSLYFLGAFLVYSLEFDSAVEALSWSSQWVIAGLALIGYGLYVGYFVGFEAFWQGQTPGKRWVKIRVIRDNAQPVGLFQVTLRGLMRPIDDLFFLGFLFLLLHAQEKRLGDWLAGTLVVQADGAGNMGQQQIEFSPAARTLAQELLATAEVSSLLPDDFALVREYLQRRSQMAPTARARVGKQLAVRIGEILQLESPGLQPAAEIDCFLEAVYLAYQEQPRAYR